MRPPSIVMFERLYLASVASGLLTYIVGYEALANDLMSDPGVAELGLGSGLVTGVIVVSLTISVLLWFFIARKASTVAKWILVVLTAIGLISIPATLAGPLDALALLGLASTALSIAAIVFLFKEDAKAWFAGEGTADPTTFD
jgi:hypothetical protein